MGKRTSNIVVKVGGELVRNQAVWDLAKELKTLSAQDVRLTLVHGGGPQATDLQKQLGQEPNIVGGRRITDKDALQVMKMVVGGLVNVELCAALLASGLSPVGLHGASALTIQANKRPPRVVSGCGPDPIDFGWVGDVVGCNMELLRSLHEQGHTPVLACLGANKSGDVFNINADIVASQVAKALAADHLVLMTSAPGVLTDINDLSSRIPTLTRSQAKAAIADGTILGGMIPKIEEAILVMDDGVGAVHIMGEKGTLSGEISTPGSVGTALLP